MCVLCVCVCARARHHQRVPHTWGPVKGMTAATTPASQPGFRVQGVGFYPCLWSLGCERAPFRAGGEDITHPPPPHTQVPLPCSTSQRPHARDSAAQTQSCLGGGGAGGPRSPCSGPLPTHGTLHRWCVRVFSLCAENCDS